MSRILTVSGSPLVPSRSARLLHHVSDVLAAEGHQIDHLAVRDLDADALLHAAFDDPSLIDAADRLAAADAVIIATPVYKAAYSGLLKAWLDLQPQFGLEGKTVLPLATGGSLAHALALDYALRPVLQSMGARHVVQGFLVVDSYISHAGAEGSDGVTTIHGDVLPGLEAVIQEFRTALAVGHLPVSA